MDRVVDRGGQPEEATCAVEQEADEPTWPAAMVTASPTCSM